MAITKLTDVSSYINTIYERALFVARERNLMTQLVTHFSARGFMTRVVPVWAQVTAESVADGVDYSNPTTMSKSTKATFTPGEVIAQALLTDQMMETDPDGAVNAASFELGEAIATKIDVDLVGEFKDLAIDLGPGAGVAADLQSFADCIAYLRNAKAPGQVNIVAHPYHWHDIWTQLGQPATNYSFLGDIANEAMRDYFVGLFLGARWYISANIAVDANNDAISGVFHPLALAFDSRRPPRLETERDAGLRATELNMTAGYAVGEYRSEWGCYYTADATAPS